MLRKCDCDVWWECPRTGLHYLNNCHANIKFTVEFEENSTIPFLGILIKRHNRTFSTSIYRKKNFTGLYTKWDSFTPRKYKVNLIRTLTFRCFRFCSSPSLLRSCLDAEEVVVTEWLSCWCCQLQHQWCFEQTAKQTKKSNHHSSQKGNNLSSTLFRGKK